jgi:hypothetical protein
MFNSEECKMIEKRFDVNGMAYTLSPEEVCENHGFRTGMSQRTHADGWTVSGYITEDYYYWVNDFSATHPEFGKVWGDFEDVVYADSEEAFQDFFEKHTPESWDYEDI